VLVVYVFFTIFALTNIITGIFVDTAIQSAQSDRDEVVQANLTSRNATVRRLKELFMEADEDCSGCLSMQELQDHLKDKRVRAYLSAMGLELHEAQGIFRLLDINEDGYVSIEEFIYGCMRLLGNAKTIDVASLIYENKRVMLEVHRVRKSSDLQIQSLGELKANMAALLHKLGGPPVRGLGLAEANASAQGYPAEVAAEVGPDTEADESTSVGTAGV